MYFYLIFFFNNSTVNKLLVICFKLPGICWKQQQQQTSESDFKSNGCNCLVHIFLFHFLKSVCYMFLGYLVEIKTATIYSNIIIIFGY